MLEKRVSLGHLHGISCVIRGVQCRISLVSRTMGGRGAKKLD